MRTSVFISALLASLALVNGLPIGEQQRRNVDSPITKYISEKEAELLNAPKAFGLPAIPAPASSGSLIGRDGEDDGDFLGLDLDDVEADASGLLATRAKHHSKSRTMIAPRITFYSGSQLANPACGGPTPKPSEMIAAVKNGGAFTCGDRIRIKNGAKSVVVRVVDYCAGCSARSVDLSTGAFTQLASLGEGVIANAEMTKM